MYCDIKKKILSCLTRAVHFCQPIILLMSKRGGFSGRYTTINYYVMFKLTSIIINKITPKSQQTIMPVQLIVVILSLIWLTKIMS